MLRRILFKSQNVYLCVLLFTLNLYHSRPDALFCLFVFISLLPTVCLLTPALG